jgi:hypothetical protein
MENQTGSECVGIVGQRLVSASQAKSDNYYRSQNTGGMRLVAYALGISILLSAEFGCRGEQRAVQEQLVNKSSSSNAGSEPGASQITRDEEHSVYAAVINELYINGGLNGDVIVEGQTSLGGTVSDVAWTTNYVKQNMPTSVSNSVFDDFLAKNSNSQESQGQLRAGAGYSIITKDEVDGLDKTGIFWDGFSNKHPRGVFVTLSRVGLNKEMNQALVCSSHRCGWKCGMGYYVLLVKVSNTWTIKHKVNVWAS